MASFYDWSPEISIETVRFLGMFTTLSFFLFCYCRIVLKRSVPTAKHNRTRSVRTRAIINVLSFSLPVWHPLLPGRFQLPRLALAPLQGSTGQDAVGVAAGTEGWLGGGVQLVMVHMHAGSSRHVRRVSCRCRG